MTMPAPPDHRAQSQPLPRSATPPKPTGPPPASSPPWIVRVWPEPGNSAPIAAVAGVAICMLISAYGLVWSRPGICWFVIALAVTATVAATRRSHARSSWRNRIERSAWASAALALVAVGAIRADGALFAWCVLAAIACGSVAVAGGRTAAGLGLGAISVAIGSVRALGWWGRGVGQLRRSGSDRIRLGRTVAVCVVLVIVFGVLFDSADSAFAHIVGRAIPSFSGVSIGRAILALTIVGPVALGLAYLAASDPPFNELAVGTARTVRRVEWVLPLAVLDALFAAFVAVQLTFLFGGRQRVLATSGLTYAQYARSGFWQLLVVVGLTVIVIGIAARVAPRTHRIDRMLIRTLVGGLCGLTLVIVASALNRLRVYDDAYGFTRERLAVGVIEIWLGVVFLLVLGAGVALHGQWVPRAAVGAAVVALLVTAFANPDRFIANHNVDRYQRTGQIDVSYLSTLSADAVPAIERLPPGVRSCILRVSASEMSTMDDDWRSWNFDRQLARESLRRLPLLTGGTC